MPATPAIYTTLPAVPKVPDPTTASNTDLAVFIAQQDAVIQQYKTTLAGLLGWMDKIRSDIATSAPPAPPTPASSAN